jgi:SAM-dependent methyltransferase
MDDKIAAGDLTATGGRTAELVERIFQNTAGALELFTIYIGERLGLYTALAHGGPATSAELAQRTGTVERYVREWLEHHASGGILDVDDAGAGPLERRYRLPPEHARVLADPDDLHYLGAVGIEVARAARPLPDLVHAFRTGGAPPPLPWEPEGRAEANRALYMSLLGKRWLPSIPDVDRRLRAEPPARIADAACGAGWSSIAMAMAYPSIMVDGFDLDANIIGAAREHAREAGVADRVKFSVTDASDPELSSRYDLVTILEGLHDMPRPVEALRNARALLVDGGAVLVADEPVDDGFTAPGPQKERYLYGWSVVGCLPAAMGDPETAGTGTVMRPATLRGYAEAAGFSGVDVLDMGTELWRFYRLVP